MGGDSRQVGGDFLAKPLDPEGPPPAPTTLGPIQCYVCLFSLELPTYWILGWRVENDLKIRQKK